MGLGGGDGKQCRTGQQGTPDTEAAAPESRRGMMVGMKYLVRLGNWLGGLMGDRNTGLSSYTSVSQRRPDGTTGPIIAPQIRR
ncbi:hypothetical protein NS506_06308 [Nocardia seriolae]|uniref:Uncharacterized protein n=1 Tax=Nocardia seriolae TaxID=37332 RepID=A0ABC9Z669_9NOCA|nr:hypothetical protein NS506_06308 [Nocardia seriolae]GEM28807.1 hypothetical protein NS2_70460 [Nocardia seriolae NBRC 15557]BEK86577.1 hypothetical protein NSERKGN1266_25280 [Nocardia seriolae]BEK94336.1 hypothetical protein NSER024013_22420 [Nocardia seriolae]GAM51305.1 ABC transporter permease [Nocardia seriolae]